MEKKLIGESSTRIPFLIQLILQGIKVKTAVVHYTGLSVNTMTTSYFKQEKSF